jgi:excisionase family DNA binding protein
MDTAERPFLTVKELAELLRVSKRTAYALVRNGEVPSLRVGGSIRIPRAELDDQLGRRSAATSEMREAGFNGERL